MVFKSHTNARKGLRTAGIVDTVLMMGAIIGAGVLATTLPFTASILGVAAKALSFANMGLGVAQSGLQLNVGRQMKKEGMSGGRETTGFAIAGIALGVLGIGTTGLGEVATVGGIAGKLYRAGNFVTAAGGMSLASASVAIDRKNHTGSLKTYLIESAVMAGGLAEWGMASGYGPHGAMNPDVVAATTDDDTLSSLSSARNDEKGYLGQKQTTFNINDALRLKSIYAKKLASAAEGNGESNKLLQSYIDEIDNSKINQFLHYKYVGTAGGAGMKINAAVSSISDSFQTVQNNTTSTSSSSTTTNTTGAQNVNTTNSSGNSNTTTTGTSSSMSSLLAISGISGISAR